VSFNANKIIKRSVGISHLLCSKAIKAERLHKKRAINEETPHKAVAIIHLFHNLALLQNDTIFAVCISLSYLFKMVTKRNQFCHIRV